MSLTARLGALLALFVAAVPASAQVFNPSTQTLKNGLQVVVVENHRAPIVTHMVWYKVGSADEVPGKSGIAHFLEHLMFKGTPTVAPGEFSKLIARNGGRDNAFTSTDYTAYFQNIAADRLDLAMRLEADRMRNLTLDDRNVDSERAVVLEERSARTDNNPAALLSEQMGAALYLNHPYNRPVIGWASEIAKLNRQDALDTYRRWYAPNNAIVVVAGDVEPAQVFALAEKYYGPLAAAPDTPVRARQQEPVPVAARRVVLEDARVRQPSWTRQYLAPSYTSGQPGQGHALEVLAELFGGSATSRLYKSLVVEQGLAAAATAWYDPTALDSTAFGISVVPRPGVAMEKLEAAVDKELARLHAAPIPPDEIERAKRRLRANVVYARDSLHTGARALGEALTTGQTVADVEAWPQRIAAVTPADVDAAAKGILDVKRSVTGVLQAPPKAPPARAMAAPSSIKPVREMH